MPPIYSTNTPQPLSSRFPLLGIPVIKSIKMEYKFYLENHKDLSFPILGLVESLDIWYMTQVLTYSYTSAPIYGQKYRICNSAIVELVKQTFFEVSRRVCLKLWRPFFLRKFFIHRPPGGFFFEPRSLKKRLFVIAFSYCFIVFRTSSRKFFSNSSSSSSTNISTWGVINFSRQLSASGTKLSRPGLWINSTSIKMMVSYPLNSLRVAWALMSKYLRKMLSVKTLVPERSASSS